MPLNFEFEVDDEYEHPALGTYFRLNTPVLRDVVKQVFFKIAMKQTGVIFFGPPRVGKTRCFKALRVEIPKRFPNAYVVSMIAVARENARHVSTIINQLTAQEGIEVGRNSSSIKQFNILVDTILNDMRQRKKNHLVLLFDELQRFASADFYQLADMVNVLDDRSIKVTVISFAMPGITKLVKTLKTVAELQIIARFMSNLRQVSGIETKDELKKILELYDSSMFYPAASGISYTEHFFPKSFAKGWRMSTISEYFWEAMYKKASGCYVSNLPMEHVSTAIRYFHLACIDADGENHPITNADIEEAIEISGFEEFCIAVIEGRIK